MKQPYFIHGKNGIHLAYECFGSPHNPSVIMIMGLGAQMQIWPDALCQGIADSGYQVIRFDNRDAGLSSHLDERGNPSLLKVWLSHKLNKKPQLPYTLKDMSKDVLALMNALEIKSAHLVGASMGGMIAQILATKKHKRVRSLVSIMSAAVAPGINDAKLGVLLRLARRPRGHQPEALLRYGIKLHRLIGGSAYQTDEQTIREQIEKTSYRSANSWAIKRQLVAVAAAGDRRQQVTRIKVPTLIVHGAQDPIIPVRMGVETAAHIKRAKLRVIQGMGHDIPPALVPVLQKIICKHLKKAEKKRYKKQLRKQAE